jgi:predicted transcriptional regulator
MDVVWAAPDAVSVRAVLDEINTRRSEPLAYTTVMTVMNRLAAKNVLRRDGAPRRYLYRATAKNAAGIALHEMIATHGDAAIAEFVSEARNDPDLLRRLRAMLEDTPRSSIVPTAASLPSLELTY